MINIFLSDNQITLGPFGWLEKENGIMFPLSILVEAAFHRLLNERRMDVLSVQMVFINKH